MNKHVVYIRSNDIYYDSRATKEITAFLNEGCRVSVFGWCRTGEIDTALEKCGQIFKKYDNRINFRFYNSQVKNGIGYKNIVKLFGWLLWIKKALKNVTDCDVVHFCDLDTALLAWKYAKKKRIKIVYDIYDYYIDSHSIPGVLQSKVEAMECKVINNADITIICTEERYSQIKKSKPKKVIVLHNSPLIENVPDEECIYDYSYIGSLESSRLTDKIFDDYHKNSSLRFVIGGYGKCASQAEELSKTYDNFSFVGKIPYDEVLKIESQSKVISSIYNSERRNHRLCAPNKFYEALALGKPVIVCKGTGIDKIVEKNNIGVVIDYSSEDFYAALNKLIRDKELCAQMGKRARKLYEELYSWSIMKKVLIEAYEELFN